MFKKIIEKIKSIGKLEKVLLLILFLVSIIVIIQLLRNNIEIDNMRCEILKIEINNIKNEDDMYNICNDYHFNKSLIDFFILNEKFLNILYQIKKLDEKNIEKAIDKGIELDVLYQFQKLDEKNIEKAIKKGIALRVLYEFQILNKKCVKIALENIDNKSNIKVLYDANTKIFQKNKDIEELYYEKIQKLINKNE